MSLGLMVVATVKIRKHSNREFCSRY